MTTPIPTSRRPLCHSPTGAAVGGNVPDAAEKAGVWLSLPPVLERYGRASYRWAPRVTTATHNLTGAVTDSFDRR